MLAIVTAWSVYILADGIAETHDVSFSDGLFPAIFIGAGSFLLALV